MGRIIDSNQNSFNNQPYPPQPPQNHQYPYQQPPSYVPPDTINIVHPPPYESIYDAQNTEENDPKIQQQQQQQFHQQSQTPPQPSPIHPTHHETSQPVTFPLPPAQPLPYAPPPPQPSPIHPTHEVLSQPAMYGTYPPPPPQMAVPFPPPSPQMPMSRAATFPQATNRPPFAVTTGGPVDMPTQNAYTIITPVEKDCWCC